MSAYLDPVQTTTIYNYKRGAEDSVMQNNRFFRSMYEKSQIESDQGGELIEGPIEAGRHTPYVSAPGEDISGRQTTKQRWKRWQLPWAQTNLSAAWNVGLLRRNNGDQALVKIRDVEVPAMLRDIFDANGSASNELGVAYQMLNTNAATYTGGGLPVQGIPTFLLPVGSTGLQGFNRSTGVVSGSGPALTDQEVVPTVTSQSYANLPMYRSGLTGVDGLEVDAWTPTQINSSATAWTGVSNDQANSLPIVYNYAVQQACRFSSTNKAMMPDLGYCDLTSFNRLGAKLDTRQTVFIDGGKQQANDTFGTGYNATTGRLFHANLWWYWDENMAGDTAFVLNFKKSKLMTQPITNTYYGGEMPMANGSSSEGSDAIKELLEMHVGFDSSTLTHLLTFIFAGQAFFHPRYQVSVRKYN
jgi:hypothetical protein